MGVDISVIIPFRDWGLLRLELAIQTALQSAGRVSAEVIVSDYGTDLSVDDMASLPEVAQRAGARYVRTETTGPWSRSLALNAGAAVAQGRVLLASDADMLMPPGCLDDVCELLEMPDTVVCLSCLDLPPHWDDVAVAEKGIDWELLQAAAVRRPRWGMGLVAATREMYHRTRGWDERLHTYGGEDNDFSVRLRRAGARVVWPDTTSTQLLHMWHPSTAARHAMSAEEQAVVQFNKAIAKEDPTFVRNLVHQTFPMDDQPPAVTFVISTYNRRRMLEDAVNSVLWQTVQDFEIVIVDDGSTDDTEEWAASLTDPRIRYFRQENAGISAARNRGLQEARGRYVAVLDDDDIALPWRIEAHFEALTPGVQATFGSFVNFNDETGELSLYTSREMNDDTVMIAGGAPGHSTWMVRTDVMRRVGYDERLTSGVDNDIALRLLRSGVRWKHSRRMLVLRRVHAGGVTVTDASRQVGNAGAAFRKFTLGISPTALEEARKANEKVGLVSVRDKEDLQTVVPKYLPDHLVERSCRAFVPADAGADQPSDGAVLIRYSDGHAEEYRLSESLTIAEIAAAAGKLSPADIQIKDKGQAASSVSLEDVLSLAAERQHGGEPDSFAATHGIVLTEEPAEGGFSVTSGERTVHAVTVSLASLPDGWTRTAGRALVPAATAMNLAASIVTTEGLA